MRPCESENDDPTPEPAPPPRAGGGLSSMVVRPPESGGGSDQNPDDNDNLRPSRTDFRRRGSPPPPNRRVSPPPFRRADFSPSFRRGSPPAFHHRRGSPSAFPRRLSPHAIHNRGSPTDFHHRSRRFNNDPDNVTSKSHSQGIRFLTQVTGYAMPRGSLSPVRRQRLDDIRDDPDFDRPVGPHHTGRGFRSGRGGRFRDVSPHRGIGRGSRANGRGYTVPGRGLLPSEGEYIHRNDPNLSPREGDWICRNPTCGNLNFARRSYCNNCNKFRFGPEYRESSGSPQKGYFNSPPPHRSPPRFSPPPSRDINVYKSPRGWDAGPARRPPYHARRERPDYREEEEYRGRGKFDFPVHEEEWGRRDRRRVGSSPDRRAYSNDRRPPNERWTRDSRERSRSPMVDRTLKGGPYVGRGQVDRRFGGPFAGRGQGSNDDLDAGRGRRPRQSDDSFVGRGRGRGDGRGIARERNGAMY